MMAICKSALAEGSGKVMLIYANRDENSVIFGAALRELAAKYPDRLTVVHWLESVQGLPSAAALAELGRAVHRPRRVHLRARTVHGGAPRRRSRSLGVPAGQIHIEVFKSLESDPFAAVVIEEDDSDEAPATAMVTLDGENHEMRGRATPSCSTSCSTRASMRRSPAARAIAARVRCSRRPATSRWRSTTCSSSPTSTKA